LLHSFVISKNVTWCHLIWPTLYAIARICYRPSVCRSDSGIIEQESPAIAD